MLRATLPLVFFAGLGACAHPSAESATGPDTAATPPGGAADELPKLAEAQTLMRQGQVDEAMLQADAILDARPDDRDARLFRARGSIALFDAGRRPAQAFLEDAQRDVEHLLDADSDDAEALLVLAYCELKLGEFESSRDSALHAAESLVASKADFDRVSGAFLQAADAEMQLFVGVRRQELVDGNERPGDDSTAAANRVMTILKSAEQRGPVPQARLRTAQVYQWMNRGLEALEALEEGIRALPDSNEMHQAFQQAYWDAGLRKDCVVAYKRMLKETPGSGALRWYLGRAQVALGDDLRRKTDWDSAASAYEEALQTFRSYGETRRSERAATGQWTAICELSLGRIAYERGDFVAAEEHFAAAYAASPTVAEYGADGLPKLYDSFGGNYLGGLSLIGKALAEQTGPDALRNNLAFYERIIERHPDRFGTIYNNAALAARDLGVQIVRSAPDEDQEAATIEAMQLWERSYAWYEQATELAPDDPRIANDCGLMLIYHLGRDYDRARELFDRAIELGEAQLAALPADATAEDRNFLEEAVGDAYQNIGVLLVNNLGLPMSEAKPFLEKAVQFYPYQQRQAARMLRNADRQGAPQGGVKARFDQASKPAQSAAEQGDWDAALLALDQLAKDPEFDSYAPFHHLYGACSLRYARAAAADGQSAALVDGLFQDAARHLSKAVELDSEAIQPRLDLAATLIQIGDEQQAADVASSLLSHLRSVGDNDPELLARVHAVRAEAAARAYSKVKQEGGDDEALLRDARTSFRELEAMPALDDRLRNLWISMERWAGASEQAIQIAVRAFELDPEQQIGALVELGAQTGTSASVVDALAGRDDATTLWWNGRAHFDLAQQLWVGGELDAAATALDDAVKLFDSSQAANDTFRDSCEQWRSLCLGSKALMLGSAGKVEPAKDAVLAALRGRPDVFENDLGNGASIKRAVLIVGDRYYSSSKLGEAAAFYRQVGELVPTDVDVANNEGLFCRDWAGQLQQRGQREAAADFYEASYAAYTRANTADPTNVRLLNDRALLLVYYLGRDLETAVELLDEAIREGERQLRDAPPDEPRALRDLQEAVGDAYGNLGIYHMRYSRDLAAARRNFEKSLEYYPFAQRAGTRELERIDRMEKEAEPLAPPTEGDAPKDGGDDR